MFGTIYPYSTRTLTMDLFNNIWLDSFPTWLCAVICGHMYTPGSGNIDLMVGHRNRQTDKHKHPTHSTLVDMGKHGVNLPKYWSEAFYSKHKWFVYFDDIVKISAAILDGLELCWVPKFFSMHNFGSGVTHFARFGTLEPNSVDLMLQTK